VRVWTVALRNNAAALRRLFAEAGDHCTDEYSTRLFSIFKP